MLVTRISLKNSISSYEYLCVGLDDGQLQVNNLNYLVTLALVDKQFNLDEIQLTYMLQNATTGNW
jgi:hypothetical protein